MVSLFAGKNVTPLVSALPGAPTQRLVIASHVVAFPNGSKEFREERPFAMRMEPTKKLMRAGSDPAAQMQEPSMRLDLWVLHPGKRTNWNRFRSSSLPNNTGLP
jgi:hypothetical protein